MPLISPLMPVPQVYLYTLMHIITNVHQLEVDAKIKLITFVYKSFTVTALVLNNYFNYKI